MDVSFHYLDIEYDQILSDALRMAGEEVIHGKWKETNIMNRLGKISAGQPRISKLTLAL